MCRKQQGNGCRCCGIAEKGTGTCSSTTRRHVSNTDRDGSWRRARNSAAEQQVDSPNQVQLIEPADEGGNPAEG